MPFSFTSSSEPESDCVCNYITSAAPVSARPMRGTAASVEDLERKIGELARRGLSVPEIADWLQVPAAEVRALLDPEPNRDPDTSGEGSFPASDAPPLR